MTEVEYLVHNLAVINCNGCKTNLPSQKHHDCCTMPFEEQIHIYFDQALETCMVSENIMQFVKQETERKLLNKALGPRAGPKNIFESCENREEPSSTTEGEEPTVSPSPPPSPSVLVIDL